MDRGAEIRWVLLRGFGPHRPFPERIDGPRAAILAGDLGLAERIGARVPPSILVAELGRDVAHQVALARLRVLASVRGLSDLIPELASILASASIPFVLLKFAALHAAGCVIEGSRAAGDLDVLVPERDVERATAALIGRGFFASEATLTDHHHHPPLRDRRGRVVELHTRLPGVRVRVAAAGRFAGYDELEAAGGLVQVPVLEGGGRLPRPDLLAAHAIAHGLAQHGGADVYPLTRMLADVLDVLPGSRRSCAGEVARWIAADVPASDIDAVLGLCDALERGAFDELVDRPNASVEGTLLRHILASALDADYRRALAVGQTFHALSDEPRWRRTLKAIQCLVWPTKGQLAARLGLPYARLVDRRLRLAHAAGLARRLPRLAWSAARLAWRSLLGRSSPSASG